MTAPDYRIYTCAEGAQRVGNDVIKESTLYRLARERRVNHTRNGRKVGWTDEQLAGVVAYLAAQQQKAPQADPNPKNTPKPQARGSGRTSTEPTPPRGDIRPLVSRPGRRYSTQTTT